MINIHTVHSIIHVYTQHIALYSNTHSNTNVCVYNCIVCISDVVVTRMANVTVEVPLMRLLDKPPLGVPVHEREAYHIHGQHNHLYA